MWESIRAGFVLMVIAAFIGSFKLSVKWKYFCIMSMLLKTPLPNWGQTRSPYLWGTGRDVKVPPSWVKSSTRCLSLRRPFTSQLGRLVGWVLPFNLGKKASPSSASLLMYSLYSWISWAGSVLPYCSSLSCCPVLGGVLLFFLRDKTKPMKASKIRKVFLQNPHF